MLTVKVFFTFWILTNGVMALNVEVVLQLSKLAYTWFIQQDAQMAIPDFEVNDITKCTVRNLNMIEELGEIEYLFCDKTGTLT